ncbi:hypothetical protein [Aliivibrio fischeri]|uniref:hypothetical protein n=1 Tax=Aliivibrio fischeri TaxID=668 RepID=UPI0007C567DE|nr:hypothetical protein [Aliivibrio fischeri]
MADKYTFTIGTNSNEEIDKSIGVTFFAHAKEVATGKRYKSKGERSDPKQMQATIAKMRKVQCINLSHWTEITDPV